MAPAVLGKAKPRIVVVGGGAGGTTAVRELAMQFPEFDLTLVDQNRRYLTPFFANRYLGGLSSLESYIHEYDRLTEASIRVIQAQVTMIDPDKRRLRLAGGEELGFDRLILSPGVGTVPGGLKGYDDGAEKLLPHAYVRNTAEQWQNLKAQLDAMDDGGVIAISVPKRPYRCHPAPYERASLIASALKTEKPHSKVLILDSNISFPLMDPMLEYWEETFGEMIEWISADFGGAVQAVDAKAKVLKTEDEDVEVAVINVIPPQRAGELAVMSGLTDETGWCPVGPRTFESRRAKNIHVLGDAIDPGDMPRSAFAANSQAKVCASQIGQSLTGRNVPAQDLANACYFLLEKGLGLVVGGAYQPRDGRITGVKGFASEAGEDTEVRAKTAADALQWYAQITKEMFG